MTQTYIAHVLGDPMTTPLHLAAELGAFTIYDVQVRADSPERACRGLLMWHAAAGAAHKLIVASGHIACTAACDCAPWIREGKHLMAATQYAATGVRFQ